MILRALAYICARLFDLTIGDNSASFEQTRKDVFDDYSPAERHAIDKADAAYKAQWEADAAWWNDLE